MQTTNSLWLLVGTLVVAGVVVVLYLGVRQQLAAEESTGSTEPTGAPPVGGEPTPAADPEQSPDDAASTDVDQSDERTEAKPERTPSRQVVDLLPDDERRIVQPVIESPGLTQIELRDRASFSKSKVSQTVTDLEKRGLLYREPQGRTYRVYPSDELSAK